MITVSTITIPTLPLVIDFLSKNEQSHIALMAHLMRDGTACLPPQNMKYYVIHEENGLFKNGSIRAVLSIDKGGNVLHYIDTPSEADDLRETLSELMSSWKIFCIMGDQEGSRLLRSLYKKKASVIREYRMMEYRGGKKQYIPTATEMVTCTPADAQSLMLIKKGYYLEEQALPGGTFYPAAHLKVLQEDLAVQTFYALRSIREDDHPFIAKANTNAQGLHWTQIGGVYTMPAWRGKGCARYLVQQLAEMAVQKGKKVALFVKVQNISAQNAYAAAGFTMTSSFEISYYTS